MKKSSFKLNVKLPILAIQNRQHKIDPAAVQHCNTALTDVLKRFQFLAQKGKKEKMLKPQKMKIFGRNNKK